MSSAQARIFSSTRRFSSLAVASVVVISAIFNNNMSNSGMTWQVVVALFALAVGIPHGALDHLVTLPRSSKSRMAIFISIYVAIAAVAVWAILTWNVVGFIAVVTMSALHFGIGDAAFITENDRASSSAPAPRISQFFYALSAGSLPVLIPLTNKKSTDALEAVNADLVRWHGGWDAELMNAVLVLSVIACAVLVASRRWRDIIDLVILGALVLVAPPLLAFAAYFGLWHAMRHTARLTLNLRSSQKSISEDRAALAFRQAVLPGIPALVGTFIVSLLIGLQSPGKLSDEYLWLSLVVVWALTVPHMMVTAKLDKAALR